MVSHMKVIKRDEREEPIHLDKITNRIKKLCEDPKLGDTLECDPTKVAILTVDNLYDGISTVEIDTISAKQSEFKKLDHPDYGILAGRICISNLHKSTPSKFSQAMLVLKSNGVEFDTFCYNFIMEHAEALDAMIVDTRDYQYDYFAFKTLERSYLQKHKVPRKVNKTKANVNNINNDRNDLDKFDMKICDRPQYMLLRVAIAIFCKKINDVKECLETINLYYNVLSMLEYTHASPTMFNACMRISQLQSCFLLGTGDSLDDIMDNLKDCSKISKWAGGIGVHMSNIRAAGSLIKGTGGRSKGLLSQLKMYNDAANCWDQGGDKRKGAFAIYIEPWHADIMEILDAKLPTGADELRTRDLFYALWIPDLFMEAVDADDEWYLFSEDTAPGLSDATGDEFKRLYHKYRIEHKARKVVRARDLLDKICDTLRETGGPYICFKDHVNRKSNQKNIGTIKSSNLCAEINEVSSKDSYACCTLASLNLKKFVKEETVTSEDGSTERIFTYDHQRLYEVTRLAIRALDNVIDINTNPVDKCRPHSDTARPIGLGVQGLANVFLTMRLPFMSDEARKLDKEIFETIYFAALTESVQLARERGAYPAFKGSPLSQGILQFDMWEEDLKRNDLWEAAKPSDRWDWTALREDIMRDGVRNSLLLALMPTATTSQILDNNESFEPYQRNIYTKRTLGGKFTVLNTHLIRQLIERGLWTREIRDKIIKAEGDIGNIEEIPQDIRDIHKTVWEMSQKDIQKRAAIRNAYVCQSASLNIHTKNVTRNVLRAIIINAWKLALKTGIYYLRSEPAVEAFKNNISVRDEEATAQSQSQSNQVFVCRRESDCEACKG